MKDRRIRSGRFELEWECARDYRLFTDRWWIPRFGKMENSPASRNLTWCGWVFRIYRKTGIADVLLRKRNRIYRINIYGVGI